MIRRLVLGILLCCAAASGSTPAPQEEGADVGKELVAVRGLLQAQEYGQAATRARELLKRTEQSFGPTSPEVADVLEVLVESLYNGVAEDKEELLGFAQRAVRIREALPGADPTRSLLNLGVVYRQMERFAESRETLDRALRTPQASVPPDSMKLIPVLQELATVCTETGALQEAKTTYERVITLIEAHQGHADPSLIKPMYNYGRLLVRMSEYEDATRYYKRALSIVKDTSPDSPTEAYILNGLANVYRIQHELTLALHGFEQALQIVERRLSENHTLKAALANNLGILSEQLGDYDKATEYFQNSLEASEKALGKEHSRTAQAHFRLGDVEYEKGNFAQALSIYEQSIKTMERAVGPDHPDVGLQLVRQSEILLALGRDGEAEALLQRSVTILEVAYDPADEHIADPLRLLGEIARCKGDLSTAQGLYERALHLRESTLGSSHPQLIPIISGLARVRANQGQLVDALELSLRAQEMARKHLQLSIRTLPEREALSYSSRLSGGLDLALTIVTLHGQQRTVRRVWSELIRARGIVLDEIAVRHALMQETDDPVTQGLVQQLNRTHRELASLITHRPPFQERDSYLQELRSLQETQEAQERALAENSATYRHQMHAAQIGLDDVRSALPPASALLAFTEYEEIAPNPPKQPLPYREARQGQASLVAFILRSSNPEPLVIALGRMGEIDTLVSRWRDQLEPSSASATEAESRYRAAATALRRRVWDPLGGALEGAQRVFVVPTGAIHFVNLSALPFGSSEYLIDTGRQFHYLSTERDLLQDELPTPQKGMTLVLGGPDYDANVAQGPPTDSSETVFRGPSPCLDFQSHRFPKLQGTMKEAREIIDLLSKRPDSAEVVGFSGAEASERAVKEWAPRSQICHLATHGFFFGEKCAQSLSLTRSITALSIARDSDLSYLVRDNPLLFSGLALAGANKKEADRDNGDDGILTALEIVSMNLHGVGWAVLSACGTGLGRLRKGEGVFGLRRAFQVAGARTVIMSLCQVADEPTREWMVDLYAARLEGLDTAAAVRRTSHDILKRRRATSQSTHPFYWAAFVATGDWR